MTPGNNTIYKALVTILTNAALGYPIIYPGETKEPPASGVWLVVQFMPNRGINFDVGNSEDVTPQGLFQVTVYDRPSAYMDNLDNAAEAVVAAFSKGTRIAGNVRVQEHPYFLSLDPQSDRMSKVVTIPYSG